MRKSILYIGLDVDDKAFHGCGFDLISRVTYEFKCKPTFGALLRKLEKFQEQGFDLKVCYEATYIGYSLCRDLRSVGIWCDLIAPSLIPDLSGRKVKTDRTDALKLAEFYAKELLTCVHVPSEAEEQVRDLIRSRSFIVKQRKDFKKHILSTCRRHRLNYREDYGSNANYWTKQHLAWLTTQINQLSSLALKKTFEILMYELDRLNEGVAAYDQMISDLASTEPYKSKVEALNCFKGLSTLSSMTLVVEIDDIRRFKHPKSLVSYVGLDIKEYSSGGKENKYGITKMGNKRIRTVLIEASQNPLSATKISNQLRKVREGQDTKIVDIADRCIERLRKKALRMQHAQKHKNKIKTACAREMVGFIWEALLLVS